MILFLFFQDKQADFIIHYYVDRVLEKVLEILQVPLLNYDSEQDPVKRTREALSRLGYPIGACKLTPIPEWPAEFQPIEWAIEEEWTKDKALIDKSKNRKIIRAKRLSKSKEENHISTHSNSNHVDIGTNEEKSLELKQLADHLKPGKEHLIKQSVELDEKCNSFEKGSLFRLINDIKSEEKYNVEGEIKMEKGKMIKLCADGHERLKQENDFMKNEKKINVERVKEECPDMIQLSQQPEDIKIETPE